MHGRCINIQSCNRINVEQGKVERLVSEQTTVKAIDVFDQLLQTRLADPAT